jgi:hypothetical protein
VYGYKLHNVYSDREERECTVNAIRMEFMTIHVMREHALNGIRMEFMAIKMSLVVVQRRSFYGYKHYWRHVAMR